MQDNAIEKFADNLADRLADEAVETTLSESCFRRVKAAEIIVAELAVLSGEKMDVESTAKKIARKLFGPARRLVLEPKGVSFQGRGWCEQAVLDVIEAELDIATTPPGWVTIGRIKVDLETETETFERAKPKQPLPEPDDPQPPAAPGDADLSPEQVAAALNARKWRGREDWMAHSVVRPGSAFVESKGRLGHNEALTYWPLDDAAALVQGWKAQDELAVQRMNTDSDRAYIASLEASVSALTAENQRLREWISTQAPHSSTLHSAQHAIEQRLAAQPPAQPDLDAIEAQARGFLNGTWGEAAPMLTNIGFADRLIELVTECRRLRAGPAADQIRNACAQALQALLRQHDENLIDVDEAIQAVMEAGRGGEAAGPTEGTWQPIETAPKEDCLLYMGACITRGSWDDDRFAKNPRSYWRSELGHVLGVIWDRQNQPTHWMPLPAAPESKE